MNGVAVIDENGEIVCVANSLQPTRIDNPAYRARIAIALPNGGWLYAPTSGHNLDQFKNVKASQASEENYQKSVKLYLAPYGAQVTATYLARGEMGLSAIVNQETIYG